MWSIVKGIIGLVVAGALVYGLFFVEVGGKSVAGHAADIWRSPAMQEKVDMVREEVRQEIEDRLAEAAEKATRDTVREKLGPPRSEFDEKDRQALADVIQAH